MATLCKVNFKHGTREGKHNDVTSRVEKLKANIPAVYRFKTKMINKIRIMGQKKVYNKHIIKILT